LYAQENKFSIELRNYRNDVKYDKVSFYFDTEKKYDSIKKWNRWNNIYIEGNYKCYSTKSYNLNDTVYLSLDPDGKTTKYWLFFTSDKVKNSVEPFIYDKLDSCKYIGYSMIRENDYINGYLLKVNIDPDIYQTYYKRFYIIFKKIRNDKSSTIGNY
jgi:hypothetical protein